MNPHETKSRQILSLLRLPFRHSGEPGNFVIANGSESNPHELQQPDLIHRRPVPLSGNQWRTFVRTGVVIYTSVALT